MKKIVYILLTLSIIACNSKKPETASTYAATPNGIADLQKPAATQTTAKPGETTATSNLLLNPAHGQPGHDCSIAVGAPLKAGTRAVTQTPQPQPQPQTVQTVTPQPTITTTNTPQIATATVDSKNQKLNPAHGQPNHRCDIAVGAPLNSKPTQAAVTKTENPKVTVTQPTTTTQVPILNEKGQRLNPAHGQPGHKCEVAVGAPLT